MVDDCPSLIFLPSIVVSRPNDHIVDAISIHIPGKRGGQTKKSILLTASCIDAVAGRHGTSFW